MQKLIEFMEQYDMMGVGVCGGCRHGLLSLSTTEKTKKALAKRRRIMFGRKKRHIAFLERENEILRMQTEELNRYYNSIENGNLVKYIVMNPSCIKNGVATVDKNKLHRETKRNDLVRIENPLTNHFTIRVIDEE